MPVHLILGLMEISFVFTENYGKGYFVCAETKVVGAQWSKANSRTLSRKWFPGTLILLYIVAVVFNTCGSQSSQAKRGIQKFTFSNWSHFLLYVLFSLSQNWRHFLASLLSRVCFHVRDEPYWQVLQNCASKTNRMEFLDKKRFGENMIKICSVCD